MLQNKACFIVNNKKSFSSVCRYITLIFSIFKPFGGLLNLWTDINIEVQIKYTQVTCLTGAFCLLSPTVVIILKWFVFLLLRGGISDILPHSNLPLKR